MLEGQLVVELGSGIGLPGEQSFSTRLHCNLWRQRAALIVPFPFFSSTIAGILAAKAGANVVLSDLDSPAILDNLRRNCAANGATCRVLPLPWGEPTPTAAALRREAPHLLLAADCLYAAALFDPLLSTAAYLLSGRPPGRAALLAAFQERGTGFLKLSVESNVMFVYM